MHIYDTIMMLMITMMMMLQPGCITPVQCSDRIYLSPSPQPSAGVLSPSPSPQPSAGLLSPSPSHQPSSASLPMVISSSSSSSTLIIPYHWTAFIILAMFKHFSVSDMYVCLNAARNSICQIFGARRLKLGLCVSLLKCS